MQLYEKFKISQLTISQLFDKMKEDINIEQSLKSGNTKEINEWLKNKIHQYGSSKYPKDILEEALNDKFNVTHYIDYLIKKYSKIYNL